MHAGAVATTDGRRLMVYFDRSDAAVTFGLDDLPADRYDLRWFDCVSGRLLKQEPTMLNAASMLNPPGGEVFLYIRPV